MPDEAPAQPVAAPPQEQAPAPPAPATTDHEPSWLKGRIDQAERSGQAKLLKDLGVEKPEDIKAALAKLREVEQAQLTEKERAEQRIAELAPKASRAEALEATVKGYADRELSGLTEAQRAAVVAVAGEDPARVLSTIELLRNTWVAPTPPVAPVSAPAPAPAPAATTSGAPPLPAAGTTTSPTDHKARFEELRRANPFAAAEYAERHFRDIA